MCKCSSGCSRATSMSRSRPSCCWTPLGAESYLLWPRADGRININEFFHLRRRACIEKQTNRSRNSFGVQLSRQPLPCNEPTAILNRPKNCHCLPIHHLTQDVVEFHRQLGHRFRGKRSIPFSAKQVFLNVRGLFLHEVQQDARVAGTWPHGSFESEWPVSPFFGVAFEGNRAQTLGINPATLFLLGTRRVGWRLGSMLSQSELLHHLNNRVELFRCERHRNNKETRAAPLPCADVSFLDPNIRRQQLLKTCHEANMSGIDNYLNCTYTWQVNEHTTDRGKEHEVSLARTLCNMPRLANCPPHAYHRHSVWAHPQGSRMKQTVVATTNYGVNLPAVRENQTNKNSPWSCDIEGHAKNCIASYCELANKKWSNKTKSAHLASKITTPKERTGNRWETYQKFALTSSSSTHIQCESADLTFCGL